MYTARTRPAPNASDKKHNSILKLVRIVAYTSAPVINKKGIKKAKLYRFIQKKRDLG